MKSFEFEVNLSRVFSVLGTILDILVASSILFMVLWFGLVDHPGEYKWLDYLWAAAVSWVVLEVHWESYKYRKFK